MTDKVHPYQGCNCRKALFDFDFRLKTVSSKGIFGDEINVRSAATTFNFKKKMNKWKVLLFSLEKFFRPLDAFFLFLKFNQSKNLFFKGRLSSYFIFSIFRKNFFQKIWTDC
jgi:hypothetical protein